MVDRPTRWGIASAGHISHDFVSALQMDDRGHHEIVAVAARSHDRAQEFAEQHKIPTAYGSYEELANDQSVDVVYVGSIPCTHADILTTMLNVRKPVLSEKPATINYSQTKRVTDLAKKNNTLFVDGMWSRFFPVFSKLREVLDSGDVGEAKLVHYMMGYKFPDIPDDWRKDSKRGGGMALSFGIYASSLAEWVFQDKPTNITATGDLTEEGGDTTCTFVLQYSHNRRLVCTVTSDCNMDNAAFITCTNGKIKIPTPWCPVKLQVNDDWYTYPLPETDVKFIYVNCPGFIYEAEHVRELLLKGSLESPVVPHASTLAAIEVIDEVRKQMGVVFGGE